MRKDAGANLSNRFILSITYLNKKNQIFSNQFYTREILVVFFFISDKRTKKIDDQITNEMDNQIKQMFQYMNIERNEYLNKQRNK